MSTTQRRAAGFTLIEIVVAIAILGILAGAVGPLVFRQLEAAREEATRRELAAIEDAIEDYHEDTGRFPADLAGLVGDDGRTGWSGPYLGADWNDPVAQVSNDGFERAYTYVLNPNVVPSGSADLIVASAGLNQSLDLPSGGTWDLNDIANVDDIVVHISGRRLNRDKERATQAELEALAEAARNHYRATSAFPAALTDLAGDYLDTGLRNDALRDEWQTDYLASIQGAGATAVLRIWSAGPDHEDDDGGDDDLELQVNAAAIEAAMGGGGP